MPILRPPDVQTWKPGQFSIFLAGSIENGEAPNWQFEIEEGLTFYDPVILNPRRLRWNPKASEEELRAQIDWELDGLARVDMIAMYFAPETKSPITLLELGLFADPNRLVVCCPEGFWRRTNVMVVCERHGIEMVPNLATLTQRIIQKLRTTKQGASRGI